MERVKIITNNHTRLFLSGYELPAKVRKDFDWMDDELYDSSDFVFYRGEYISMHDFTVCNIPGWDGVRTDSAFSGVVIKVLDSDTYKIGLYLC